MTQFDGSYESFRMLRRLAKRGSLRNFNDVIADQLVQGGYAIVQAEELVPTEKGSETVRNLAWNSPRSRARQVDSLSAGDRAHAGRD